jgi:ClpP class serine protease
MSSFGSTTEDIDGVPIDRGPPEENRMTEAELRGTMRSIADAKLTMGEQATVKGLVEQVLVLQEMVDSMTEQHNRMVGLVQTTRNELAEFKQQWNIERVSWLAGGGSTTREDVEDGA